MAFFFFLGGGDHVCRCSGQERAALETVTCNIPVTYLFSFVVILSVDEETTTFRATKRPQSLHIWGGGEEED